MPLVAVDRRGVDEVDAGVERGVRSSLLVVDDAPPVAGEGPGAEADLGDLEVALTEAAVAHGDSFRPCDRTCGAKSTAATSGGSSPARRASLPSRSSRSAARRP